MKIYHPAILAFALSLVSLLPAYAPFYVRAIIPLLFFLFIFPPKKIKDFRIVLLVMGQALWITLLYYMNINSDRPPQLSPDLGFGISLAYMAYTIGTVSYFIINIRKEKNFQEKILTLNFFSFQAIALGSLYL